MTAPGVADTVKSESPTVQPAVPWWIWATVALTWVATAVMAVPGLTMDRGVFVSVAERLLAGDRLYVEVWDNKDPLFYYALAAGRLVHPWADVALELGWLMLAAWSTMHICQQMGCDRPRAVIVGWLATPLILTGPFYYPGYTNLPGTAVTLAILMVALRGKAVVAGLGLAILFFLKIVYFPVAVVLVAIVVIASRRWRDLAGLAGGFGITAGLTLLILAARGELGGYRDMLVHNFAYANVMTADEPLVGHLTRIAGTGPAVWVSLLMVVILLGASIVVRGGERLLEYLAWGAALSVLVVLGTTGMWDHHNQMLYLVGLLCVALVAIRITNALACLLAVSVLALLLGGGDVDRFGVARQQAAARLDRLGALSPQAQALLATGQPSTYARFGGNDDDGHAFGLEQWELACPSFHQYPFDPDSRLSDHAACLPRAERIIVSETGNDWLAAPPDDSTGFGRFLTSVRVLLARDYDCEWIGPLRICSRSE